MEAIFGLLLQLSRFRTTFDNFVFSRHCLLQSQCRLLSRDQAECLEGSPGIKPWACKGILWPSSGQLQTANNNVRRNHGKPAYCKPAETRIPKPDCAFEAVDKACVSHAFWGTLGPITFQLHGLSPTILQKNRWQVYSGFHFFLKMWELRTTLQRRRTHHGSKAHSTNTKHPPLQKTTRCVQAGFQSAAGAGWVSWCFAS